jgi:hypothetical protein
VHIGYRSKVEIGCPGHPHQDVGSFVALTHPLLMRAALRFWMRSSMKALGSMIESVHWRSHPLGRRILDSGSLPSQGSSRRFGMVRASVRPRSPRSPGPICKPDKQGRGPDRRLQVMSRSAKRSSPNCVPTFTWQVAIATLQQRFTARSWETRFGAP